MGQGITCSPYRFHNGNRRTNYRAKQPEDADTNCHQWEFARRSLFSSLAGRISVAEAKLKNSIYARYFTKVSVCKEEHWISSIQAVDQARRSAPRLLPHKPLGKGATTVPHLIAKRRAGGTLLHRAATLACCACAFIHCAAWAKPQSLLTQFEQR